MKLSSVFIAALFSLFLFCSIPALLFSAQQNGGTMGITPSRSFSYGASGEKLAQGKNLQYLARKEYKICLEHCADEPECKARCAKAYSRRMQALEYQTN
ncbi:MAG: hypothetical protein RBR09_08825 [Desulfobulbaceae bacterium]|jgi:hypothetical protein|nr:hypothetical protein [Desulfobulbaceae bacterium]MDY0351343.1 hypothetical protein [Desulfobulbaceae bacterium]